VDIGDGALSFPDADGSANQVIKTDGSGALSFVTPAAGGLVPLAQISSTNQASADFDGVFTSTYDQYFIEGHMNPATDGVDLWCRLDTGGGGSYPTGSYSHCATGQTTGGNRILNQNSDGAVIMSFLTIGAGNGIGNAATEGIHFCVWVMLPLSTTYETILNYMTGGRLSSSTWSSLTGSGGPGSAKADDSIQFLASSGNGDFEIRAYGVVNS
jgi:hypothetical protein